MGHVLLLAQKHSNFAHIPMNYMSNLKS